MGVESAQPKSRRLITIAPAVSWRQPPAAPTVGLRYTRVATGRIATIASSLSQGDGASKRRPEKKGKRAPDAAGVLREHRDCEVGFVKISEPRAQLNIGANFKVVPPPDGKIRGHLDAGDPVTGGKNWGINYPEPPLATVGNMVFVPDAACSTPITPRPATSAPG
jgi:hypothetical protein